MTLFSCSTSADWFDVWKTYKDKIIPLTIDYKNKLPRQKLRTNIFSKMVRCIYLKKTVFEI